MLTGMSNFLYNIDLDSFLWIVTRKNLLRSWFEVECPYHYINQNKETLENSEALVSASFT